METPPNINPNGQPDIRPFSRKQYRLEKLFTYTWQNSYGTWHRLRIAPGFTYDGATVPRWAWTLSGLTPDGLIRAAALIHDVIYRYKGKLPYGYQFQWDGTSWKPVEPKYSRKDADEFFLKTMLEYEMRPGTAYTAYVAVRIGGKKFWKDA